MKAFKTRHQFYLADDRSARLDAHAARPGAPKTAILTNALYGSLERRADKALDARFGPRLDRLARASERIEQKVEFVPKHLASLSRINWLWSRTLLHSRTKPQ